MATDIKSQFALPPLPGGLEYPKVRYIQSGFMQKPDGIISFLRRDWGPILAAGITIDWQTLQTLDYKGWQALGRYLKTHELPEDILYTSRPVSHPRKKSSHAPDI